jgi:hypothetical protein
MFELRAVLFRVNGIQIELSLINDLSLGGNHPQRFIDETLRPMLYLERWAISHGKKLAH